MTITIRKHERKIALFDMDGTLVDYHNVLKNDMIKLMSPTEKISDFECNLSAPNYLYERKMLITSQSGWWENLPKKSEGWDILQECINIGYEIMILTKGPDDRSNAWGEKVRWINKHIPDLKNITITTDKSIVYGRVLVDDYPDYIMGWLSHRPRGLVIMPKSNLTDFMSNKPNNVLIYDKSSIDSFKIISKCLKEQFERK